MAGDSITHTKTGIALALKSLNPVDRFAVIGFGSSTLAFDAELQPANRKNLGLANDFVDQLPDLGGTEMEAALELALSYGKTVDILLLTDGECWHLEGAAEKAKTQGSRIFTVGIGSAVAESTVRMLADVTGGACELFTPNEDMATRIAAHFDRMRQARRITQTELVWGQTPAWTVESQHARFAGDSSLIWAELNETVGEIEGRAANRAWPVDGGNRRADPQPTTGRCWCAWPQRLACHNFRAGLPGLVAALPVGHRSDRLPDHGGTHREPTKPANCRNCRWCRRCWRRAGEGREAWLQGIRASRSRAPMMMSFAADAVESLNANYDVPIAVRSRRSTPLPAP